MTQGKFVSSLLAVLVLALPLTATAVVEPETKTEYPDEIDIEAAGETITLMATGVGLREKTFLKVDVYTIVSYVARDAGLGDDPGHDLRTLDVPKRIQMDLLRGFSRQKLVDSFQDVIDKNYEDTAAFAADLETFLAYFDRDAEDGDRLIFEHVPGRGLTTSLNGEVKGVIDNADFSQALWTVWFGEKPANDGLKRDLTAALAVEDEAD
jgi:hypothetical protein